MKQRNKEFEERREQSREEGWITGETKKKKKERRKESNLPSHKEKQGITEGIEKKGTRTRNTGVA